MPDYQDFQVYIPTILWYKYLKNCGIYTNLFWQIFYSEPEVTKVSTESKDVVVKTTSKPSEDPNSKKSGATLNILSITVILSVLSCHLMTFH